MRRSVETSTPYPPRRHEDDALHSSSGERCYTSTRGSSRYVPYSPTGRRRAGQTVRAAVHELEALREKSKSRRSAPRINDVRFQDVDRIKYAEEYNASSARHADTGRTRAELVKQSASLAPTARMAEKCAAYAPAAMRDAETEPRKQTREIGTETDSSSKEDSS